MKGARIGITLSQDALRWVEVAPGAKRCRLLRSGSIPRDGDVDDANLIAQLREQLGPAPRVVRVLDDVRPPVLRVAELPSMPDRDRRQALIHEARLEEEILGGEVVYSELLLAPGGGTTRSLLAVLPHARLKELRAAFSGSGFVLEGICVGPVLLLDTLREIGMLEEDLSIAMVDVGSSRANLAVSRQGELNLIRQVHQGVDSSFLTGTDGGSHPAAAGASGAPADLLEEVDRGLLDLIELVGQIRRTLDRAEGAEGGLGGVERLYLAGEAAQARSLAPLLQNDLRIPVEVLDPRRWASWDGTDQLTEEEAPSFALTLALAGLRSERLRLTIGRPRREFPLRKVLIGASAAGLLVNLLLVGSIHTVGRDVARLRDLIEAKVARIAASPLATEADYREWLRDQRAFLEELPDAGELLDAVARSIPTEARLEAFSLAMDEEMEGVWVLTLDGIAGGSDPPARQGILDRFVDRLRRSGLFRSVRLAPLSYGTGPSTRRDPLRFTVRLSNGDLELGEEAP